MRVRSVLPGAGAKVPGLFFAGSLMKIEKFKERDWKRSGGGGAAAAGLAGAGVAAAPALASAAAAAAPTTELEIAQQLNVRDDPAERMNLRY